VFASVFLCTGIWILAATLQGWHYPMDTCSYGTDFPDWGFSSQSAT
jgi:hypothetical protein